VSDREEHEHRPYGSISSTSRCSLFVHMPSPLGQFMFHCLLQPSVCYFQFDAKLNEEKHDCGAGDKRNISEMKTQSNTKKSNKKIDLGHSAFAEITRETIGLCAFLIPNFQPSANTK